MDDRHSTLTDLLNQVLAILEVEEQSAYLVGGFVRDTLIGRPSHDIDLIVPENAIPLTFRLADQIGLPAYRLDAERDVGRIVIPGTAITLDIARFRGPDLMADLYSRDFTINSMAMPARPGAFNEIIDPHRGQEDLVAGNIRMIHRHSVAEDPVRALRAARFAVELQARITPETLAAAHAVASDLALRISPERIRDELNRLLLSREPHSGIGLLEEIGLLTIVLPEVAALMGLNQSPPHREPVYEHTLSTLRWLLEVEEWLNGNEHSDIIDWQTAIEPHIGPYRNALREHLDEQMDGGVSVHLLLRWGALMHDTGKAITQTIEEGGRIRFLGHDEAGERLARSRLNALNFSNQVIRMVTELVGGHMRPLFLASEQRTPSRRTIHRFFRSFPTAGLLIPLHALADHLATYDGLGDKDDYQWLITVINSLYSTYFTAYRDTVAPVRLLTGQEIMQLLDISQGPEIGQLVKLLEENQAAGEITSREQAESFLRRYYADSNKRAAANH